MSNIHLKCCSFFFILFKVRSIDESWKLSHAVTVASRPAQPDHHHHQHKQNNHPAGGTKGREKRGRWGSVVAELDECQGRGGVVESVRLPHPLPGCCEPPQVLHDSSWRESAHFFFFFFQCSAAHFSQSDGQPGGNVHGRHKPVRFLIHTLLSFSLCVAPEELYCPLAQQLHIPTTEP